MTEEVVEKVRIGPWVIGKVVDGEKPKEAPSAAQINQTDVAFVIDATASMGPWIDEARRQARSAADAVMAGGHLDAQFLLVAYRDHPPQESSWVTQTWPCASTNDLQARLADLKPVGGGDGPEAVWDGVAAALDSQLWRPGSARLLYLIGDSPPHGHAAMGDGFPQGCPCGLTAAILVQRLRQQNITVHAISVACDPETTAAFRRLADGTGGTCVEAQAPAQMTHHYEGTLRKAAHANKVALAAFSPLGSAAVNWSGENMKSYAAASGTPLEDVEAAKAQLLARGLVK